MAAAACGPRGPDGETGMAIRLTLVCHAATAATRATTFPADEPIEPAALDKLARVAHRLSADDPCWVSPATRAGQTAAALGLAGTVEPALRECAYGHWAGLSLEAVQARQPQALAAWLSDPAAAPHGGESVLDVMARVGSWLDRQQGMTGRLVAVTHATVIRAAVVQALEASPRTYWRLDIPPLSCTTLSGEGGRWNLTGLGGLPLRRSA